MMTCNRCGGSFWWRLGFYPRVDAIDPVVTKVNVCESCGKVFAAVVEPAAGSEMIATWDPSSAPIVSPIQAGPGYD